MRASIKVSVLLIAVVLAAVFWLRSPSAPAPPAAPAARHPGDVVLRLRDGGMNITKTASGEVRGVERLPAATRVLVEAALATGELAVAETDAKSPRTRPLTADERAALTRALEGSGGSDLARAVTYARFGQLEAADAALARLAAANPGAGIIDRLRLSTK